MAVITSVGVVPSVAIIAANNPEVSPYIFFYTDILDRMGIRWVVYYPNRKNMKPYPDKRFVSFEWNGPCGKIGNYFRYNSWIKKQVRDRYSQLIVLTAGVAVSLCDWLCRHYRSRFIVDIRDYSHEYNRLYFHREAKAIKHSSLAVVSSRRFLEFLPQHDYVVCHNFRRCEVENVIRAEFKKSSPVVIGYVGSVNYERQCMKLINLVSKDERFRFHFYGSGPAEAALRNYVAQFDDSMIEFYGRYNPSEKSKIVNSVDILFNAYGNDTPLLQCALSNKLYDAFLHHKLLLTSPNTYMEEYAGMVSYSIDLESAQNLDGLYAWYLSLDKDVIDNEFSELTRVVLQENNMAEIAIVNAVITAS